MDIIDVKFEDFEVQEDEHECELRIVICLKTIQVKREFKEGNSILELPDEAKEIRFKRISRAFHVSPFVLHPLGDVNDVIIQIDFHTQHLL